MAHYFAARFFADPIVSFVPDATTNRTSVYTVTDRLTLVASVQLVVQLWTWSSLTPLFEWRSVVDIVSVGVSRRTKTVHVSAVPGELLIRRGDVHISQVTCISVS